MVLGMAQILLSAPLQAVNYEQSLRPTIGLQKQCKGWMMKTWVG